MKKKKREDYRTLEDWLLKQLNSVYTGDKIGEGYEFNVIITQGKRRIVKNGIRFLHRRDKITKKKRLFGIERAYWITIEIIKRMKSQWLLHSGRARIRITPIHR